jgi:predicted MFS family arabinose efflux permease
MAGPGAHRLGDTAASGRAGHAYGWYSTAHYGAIAVGPFLGGVATQWRGYRPAFVASAVVISVALAVGVAIRLPPLAHAGRPAGATLVEVSGDLSVWAGWTSAVSGLLIQGVVFTFFPLLASARGLTPGAIGLVFLVLGVANTLARFPAGWLIDRTGRYAPYAVGGLLVGSLVTALRPHANAAASVLALAAVFGAVSGLAFVAKRAE